MRVEYIFWACLLIGAVMLVGLVYAEAIKALLDPVNEAFNHANQPR